LKSYFIDTNIIMYAYGNNHKYKESCIRILRFVALNEIFGIVNVEVFQEIIYRYASIGKKTEGIEIAKNILKIAQATEPVEKEDIQIALDVFEKYNSLGARDALHLATMIKTGLRYIISADKHFDKIKEIQRIDPLEF